MGLLTSGLKMQSFPVSTKEKTRYKKEDIEKGKPHKKSETMIGRQTITRIWKQWCEYDRQSQQLLHWSSDAHSASALRNRVLYATENSSAIPMLCGRKILGSHNPFRASLYTLFWRRKLSKWLGDGRKGVTSEGAFMLAGAVPTADMSQELQ